ncbi:MAG: YjzC family protein [Candidatus Sabulitectum sp.]|nr:YjzC family protein [Candidatus Sabulitectum sp.]
MAMQKPGEKPAMSGEYLEVGPRGGQVPAPRQVSIEKGDTPLSPTQKPGRKWIKVGPVKP